MTTTTYTFESLSSYTLSNANDFDNTGDVLKLKQAVVSTDYTEDFADDTGFTYDNTKAEFAGGKVQQKYQLPSSMVCAATFTSTKDLNYITSGSTIGTYNGSPSLSSGSLICSADTTAKGVYYTSDAIGAVASVFSINFKYKPAYSGTPAPNSMAMVSLQFPTGAANNRFMLYHSNSAGYIRFNINNDAGTSIAFGTQINGVFNPTAGTEYEIEICVDTTAGSIRLFINGTLMGTAAFAAFTRGTSATRLSIGSDVLSYNCSADFSHGILYNDIQHTATYTPGYVPPETSYASSNVTMPEMEHTVDGTFVSFDELDTAETGSPRYTLQIGRSGNYLYHNGTGWVTSDDSYSQSSPKADFNTYKDDLDIEGEVYGQFKIHFPDANTQSNVDNLTVTVSEDGDYPTTNPAICFNGSFKATDISNLAASLSEVGDDKIKFVFNRNGQDYWYNSATPAWETSDGYAKSNEYSELSEAILDTLTNGNRYSIYVKVYFHSDDGTSTPELTNYAVTFDYAIPDPITPNIVDVEFFVHNKSGPVSGLVVYVRPYGQGYFNNGVFVKYDWDTLGTTDANGYVHGDIYLQGDSKFWEFKIGKQTYKANLLDITDMNLKDAPTFSLIEED